MTKILIISPYPPPRDGIGEHTRHLAIEWAKTHQVSIMALQGDGDDTEHIYISKEETRAIRIARILTLTGRKEARQFIHKLQPDIVYCQFAISAFHSSLPSVFAALRTARQSGARVICGFHEPVRETAALPYVASLLYRAAATRSDLAVCFSQAASQSMQDMAPGLPVRVVAHGIPELDKADSELVTAIRQRYENRSIVLAFGFIHPDKGADVLIDAAGILAADYPQLRPVILIAGSVRTRKGIFKLKGRSDQIHHRKLREQAARTLGGLVKFTEYVPPRELPALLAATAIAVLPYRAGTQSGIASHTLAAGLPCIASDLSGLREQLGKSANYVPIGSAPALAHAIAGLLTDPNSCEKMRDAARLQRDGADYSKVASDIIA